MIRGLYSDFENGEYWTWTRRVIMSIITHKIQFGSVFWEEPGFLVKMLIYYCCPNFQKNCQSFQGFDT